MKRFKGFVLALVVLPFLLGMGGCPSIGLPTPQGTEQSIAYMYPTIGTVASETTKLLKAGKITKAEGQTVLAIVDNAKSATDIAQQYVTNKETEKAAASIALARSILTEAQKFLNSRKE